MYHNQNKLKLLIIMGKKKLITLAREMEKETESEYFDYLIETYFNGQLLQCKRLFSEMKKSDQKSFLSYCKSNDYSDIYEYFFNLFQ